MRARQGSRIHDSLIGAQETRYGRWMRGEEDSCDAVGYKSRKKGASRKTPERQGKEPTPKKTTGEPCGAKGRGGEEWEKHSARAKYDDGEGR